MSKRSSIYFRIDQKQFETGKYDFFDKEGSESLLVLNYPYFMNEFIADFFIDVIKQSAKY